MPRARNTEFEKLVMEDLEAGLSVRASAEKRGVRHSRIQFIRERRLNEIDPKRLRLKLKKIRESLGA